MDQNHLSLRTTNVQTIKKIFNVLVRPSLEFGLAHSHITPANLKELQDFQNWAAKQFLNVPDHYPNAVALADLDWPSIATRLTRLQLKFFNRLRLKPEGDWCKAILEKAFSDGPEPSSPCMHILNTLLEYGLGNQWRMQPCSEDKWEDILNWVVTPQAYGSLFRDLQNKVQTNNSYILSRPTINSDEPHLNPGFNSWEAIRAFLGFRAGECGALRSDRSVQAVSHFHNLQLACPCGKPSTDETHFHVMMSCSLYSELRRSFSEKIGPVLAKHNLHHLNPKDLMHVLLGRPCGLTDADRSVVLWHTQSFLAEILKQRKRAQ